jgi:DNA-binding transcriptional MerR regulator
MGRKRSLDKINKLEFISIGELSILSGFRQSTLKYYSEISILPFKQEGPGLQRRFHRINSQKRLVLIRHLIEAKHYSIEDLIVYFQKHHKSEKVSI